MSLRLTQIVANGSGLLLAALAYWFIQGDRPRPVLQLGLLGVLIAANAFYVLLACFK